MKKINKDEVIKEMRRIYDANNKTPTINEWRSEASISPYVVISTFGGWYNGWREVGLLDEAEYVKNQLP